jgi:ArsR family transcriptional regulator, zinc-responsive transcriptional repressor
MIPMETLEVVARALRVLAHPVRLKLVELLLDEEVPVGELADRVGIAPHVASQHLNNLRAHGLLAARRDGKSVLYRVVGPEAVNVIECIRRHYT